MGRRLALLGPLFFLVLLIVMGCGGQLAPSYLTGQMKIGFVPKTLDQEFWVTTEKGARAGGRKADATVLVQAPTGELAVDEQIAIVENLLTQNIDALVVAPSDSILMKPVLERASEEVPVILLDTDIPKWKPKDSYVGTDNFAAGLEAGRYLKRQMNGEGSIGLITGIPGSVPGDQREAGMRKGVENTDIKVVGEVAADFDRLKAVGAMEDLLQTHPNLDAVFATNDQMALGAIEALQTYVGAYARGLGDLPLHPDPVGRHTQVCSFQDYRGAALADAVDVQSVSTHVDQLAGWRKGSLVKLCVCGD